MSVIYKKPVLTVVQQATLLIDRGIIVNDISELSEFLAHTSYYHLSAYLFPFKEADSERFKPGTTFEMIYRRYTFDRRFRIMVLDAIERVETAMKARIVNEFSVRHGAFGYLNIENFNHFPEDKFNYYQSAIANEIRKSKEQFVKHFRDKYTNEHLPFWMAIELISFGTLFTIFRYMRNDEQKRIARTFCIPSSILVAWLHTLNYVRNICAHHARLWNIRLALIPRKPTNSAYPQWGNVDAEKPFMILLMLSHLLRYCAPRTHWRQRMEDLVDEYADLPFDRIGFPENWKNHPVWRQ